MKRAALYVRVSTEEQKKHGLSVDAQITALTDYAKDNNYQIVDVYNDAGISARKSYKKRPALLRLIEDCKLGKIDLIIFTKLDRWFRSVADYYDVQRVLDEHKVNWRCIWEDYETETSAGVFKVNIMLSVAQSESDRTSERIKQTNQYKKSLGQVCTGGVATGYVIKDKRWYFDESKYEGVRTFFDTYLETFSIVLSLKACEDIGFHFTNKNASRFLRNTAYWGEPAYVAESYITEEQHKLIEPSLRSITRNNKYTHLFNGIIYCAECGGRMSPVGARKDRSAYYPRYICSNHTVDASRCIGTSVRESVVEQYLLDAMEERLKNYRYLVESSSKDIDRQTKIARLKSKLKRIKDLYELGDMELEEYKLKRALFNNELDELSKEDLKVIPTLPENWKELYGDLDREHKKSFWGCTLSKIVIKGRMECDIDFFF